MGAELSHQQPLGRGQPLQQKAAHDSSTTCTAPPCQKTPSGKKSKSAPSHVSGSGTTLNGSVCRGLFQRVEEFPHQSGSPTDFPLRSQHI